MATLLLVKADVEKHKDTRMNMIFSGASEAHLLAQEIGESRCRSCWNDGLQPRAFCHSQCWSRSHLDSSTTVSWNMGSPQNVSISCAVSRTRVGANASLIRRLAGPPITNGTAVTTLLKHGVTVALGVAEGWETANTRFDVGWVRRPVKLV
jgi:hypothetical protein